MTILTSQPLGWTYHNPALYAVMAVLALAIVAVGIPAYLREVARSCRAHAAAQPESGSTATEVAR